MYTGLQICNKTTVDSYRLTWYNGLIKKGHDMTYTFDESILSDLHKEAYGYRPAAAYYDAWSEMADFAKQAEWDRLVRLVKEEYERERLMEDLAHERWSAHLAQLMADNGIDYATALRWDMATIASSGASPIHTKLILTKFSGRSPSNEHARHDYLR